MSAAAGALGYTSVEAGAAPEGADLGLGCGNPTAIAFLREGETVLDLGSGGGGSGGSARQAMQLLAYDSPSRTGPIRI